MTNRLAAWVTTILLAASASSYADDPMSSSNYTIYPSILDGGGDLSSSATYSLLSSIAQAGGVDSSTSAYDVENLLQLISGAASTSSFQLNRGSLTYQNMLTVYGRPWPPNSGQMPSVSFDPASILRVVTHMTPYSIRAGFWNSEDLSAHSYPLVLGKGLREQFSFEMLLGNEAFSDAMDPTVGLNGVGLSELGQVYCFQGVAGSGINSLLDEELALLRGRALPGTPSQWLDDSIYYPEYVNPSLPHDSIRQAVYNRLPPNAGAAAGSVAYKSNYRDSGQTLNNNYQAAKKYPQGQGDAWGYYLTGTKTYLDVFRGEPGNLVAQKSGIAQGFINAQINQVESVDPGSGGGGDAVPVPYDGVRNMASAMAARTRAGIRVVDFTFRRDYQEPPVAEQGTYDPALFDTDTNRAWGMADWARRTAMGAYFDWAATNQLLPAPSTPAPEYPLGVVHRDSVSEIAELASAVSEVQERVDAAGAGLNPLGLVQNVVPFGINASTLGTGTGQSHYQQVKVAACQAMSNARGILNWANQAAQRMREQGEAQTTFGDQVAEREADFTNRLIELYGYPSVNDPADNDLDPSTNDVQEASSLPDLVNFLLDSEELAQLGWTARIAPGEIQLAMSELRVSELRGDEADAALTALEAEIDDLKSFIEFRTETGEQEINIINEAGVLQMKLTDRLKELKTRCNWWCKLKKVHRIVRSVVKAIAACVGTVGGACAPAVAGAVNTISNEVGAASALKALRTEFDIQKERERINTWKEVQLTGIRIQVEIERERLRLQSLIRQTPQLMVNLAIAGENAAQAMGRLQAAVQRGARLQAERERIRTLQRENLQEYRWKDLAFRVFRNNALQQYGAFYDIAARYVFLTARAFAYEYNDRTTVNSLLANIHRERLLGSRDCNNPGLNVGLQGIINQLEVAATVNTFNSPYTNVEGVEEVSVRTNLLGYGPFADDTKRFRYWMESLVVQRLQDLPAIRDFAQISPGLDNGPAIVIPFTSEIGDNNFFGNGPEDPFGPNNFLVARNVKIRSVAVVADGSDFSGVLGNDSDFRIFLLPVGESVLREVDNGPEVGLPRPWAAVDQWLPIPLPGSATPGPTYNPWAATVANTSNYLNAVKRFLPIQARVSSTGLDPLFQPGLAGRAAWNTQWLLIIPGGQWSSSSSPPVIRSELMQFIYGPTGNPSANVGITDIRFQFHAYQN